MIPPEKTAAVAKALRKALGADACDDIRRISNGAFNKVLVYRIVAKRVPYLLRIIQRADDPTCHFTCMRAAAAAGLAPRVLYTSVEDRVAITDFVEGVVALPRTEAIIRMPRLLRSLQTLPPFPERASHLNTSCTFLLHKGPALDGLLERFRTADILPKDQTEELLARHSQLAAVYPAGDEMAPSHNDLFKPDNILFDGERMWLVDWEAAFLNDRYADPAVVANMIVTNEAEEEVYLREFFGKPASEYQRARFFLMQQLAHIFYTLAFLLAGSAGTPMDWSEPVPEYADFQRRFWTGEIKLEDSRTKTAFGRVHWEELQRNVKLARFAEALRIVPDGAPAAANRVSIRG
jgi:thiamine kinase-like enzyme